MIPIKTLISVALAGLLISGFSRPSQPTKPRKEPGNSLKINRSVEEYEVLADSFDGAILQCRAKGKNGWAGFTSWELDWKYNYSDYSMQTRKSGDRQIMTLTELSITITELKVDQTVHLPKLAKGTRFNANDTRKWKAWFKNLEAHEQAHERLSSVKQIEDWFKRRTGTVTSMSGSFPINHKLTREDADTLIKSRMDEIHTHALGRIRDKDRELDQMTNHRNADIDWRNFLKGYF